MLQKKSRGWPRTLDKTTGVQCSNAVSHQENECTKKEKPQIWIYRYGLKIKTKAQFTKIQEQVENNNNITAKTNKNNDYSSENTKWWQADGKVSLYMLNKFNFSILTFPVRYNTK